eukprot:SAG11_NODE_1022_length_6155_cov_9.320456_1_plen_215_part_00
MERGSVGELTHEDVELLADLTEAGYYLNYLETYDQDRQDTIHDAVNELNAMGISMAHADGDRESVDFEVLEGEAFDALAGEIYGRQLIEIFVCTHFTGSYKIHFEIDMPEWMARRKDNRFTIKAIRAIREDHPSPDTHIRDAIEAGSCGDDLEPGEFVVTKLWARRYDDKHKRYEYKVMWAGLPSSEASYVAEDQISAPRLMEDFDLPERVYED